MFFILNLSKLLRFHLKVFFKPISLQTHHKVSVPLSPLAGVNCVPLSVKLVLNNLEMVIKSRLNLGIKELIHHSDQGVQYASNEYVDRLKELGIKISMSGKGKSL